MTLTELLQFYVLTDVLILKDQGDQTGHLLRVKGVLLTIMLGQFVSTTTVLGTLRHMGVPLKVFRNGRGL